MSWAYYQEPTWYEVEISAECKQCEKEYDTWGNVKENSSTVYWKCPKCKYENETEID